MGSLLTCCVSNAHCACCSVISILGVLFYMVFFITVTLQPQFMDIKIKDEAATRITCLVAAGFYAAFFVVSLVVQFKNRQRQKSNSNVGQYRRFVDERDQLPGDKEGGKVFLEQ